MLLFAVLRMAILVFAYFGSPVAPISLVDSAPITALDGLAGEYWAWAPGYWLTPGHLILILLWPVGTVASQAVGRRRAAIGAFVSWAVPGAVLGFLIIRFGPLFTVAPIPPDEVLTAFVIAAAMSEFLIWRGLSPRAPRARDAAICAAVFSILFNALTYGLDPSLAGPRLITQTLIFAAASWIVAAVLERILIARP